MANPPSGGSAPASKSGAKPSASPSSLYGWVRTAVLAALLAFALSAAPRALRATHLAPAFVAGSLPPYSLYAPLTAAVGALDDLLRSLTPPNLYLWRHLMGHLHTSQLHVVARLGVADALAAGAKTSLALARELTPCAGADAAGAAGCAAVALRLTRLLRATAAYGVFVESAPETWSHTRVSRFLISAPAQPASLRASALLFGGTQYASLAAAYDSVVTGESSFVAAHGSEFWTYYEAHPADHAVFDDTMREIGALGGADTAIATDFLWGKYVKSGGTLVDVGGGLGDMLSQIMVVGAGGPVRSGVVFDLPSVTERSRRVWAEAQAAGGAPPAITPALARAAPAQRRIALGKRVSFMPGSFFEAASIPTALSIARARAADSGAAAALEACTAPPVAYALRDIVHDWPDVDVVRMLGALGSAMRAPPTRVSNSNDFSGNSGPPKTCLSDRLMLVARLVQPGAGLVASQGTNDADYLMLANFGTTAGERTLDHFKALLAEARLKLESVQPLRGYYSVLVVRKA